MKNRNKYDIYFTIESDFMALLRFIDTDYRYGYHATKYPSMLKTITAITKDTSFSAMQIYISSPKSKAPPTFDYVDLMATRKIIENSGIYVVIHGCLLYNLAGTTNGEKDGNYHSALASTLQSLTAELDFGVIINAGVVVHPGTQKNTEDGLIRISKSIEEVLTRKTVESEKIAKLLNIDASDVIKRRIIILENAAGEGTKLCSTLEEISKVINGVKKDLRCQIKVCIDTAHSFGRGIYDWGKKGEIEKFYKDFDKIIGLNYLELFHFNDSMKSDEKSKNAPFGSRKDRHQQLGSGWIFGGEDRLGQIKTFMLEARKHKIAIIGEPPESGLKDWCIVSELLENTEYPLMKIM